MDPPTYSVQHSFFHLMWDIPLARDTPTYYCFNKIQWCNQEVCFVGCNGGKYTYYTLTLEMKIVNIKCEYIEILNIHEVKFE